MDSIYTFRRKENKYLITPRQQERLLEVADGRLRPDEHGKSTVLNIYLDTASMHLIRESIDVTDDERRYKEKLRLRSYGVPGKDSTVYFELKKKYEGIVYKRRISAELSEIEAYLAGGSLPEDSQIMREIDCTMKRYGFPQPAFMICYEREAFYSRENEDLRISLDSSVRYRTQDLDMTAGSGGTMLFDDDTRILEIKTSQGYPLWLSGALSELGIGKKTFSKVGTAFTKEYGKPFSGASHSGIINF